MKKTIFRNLILTVLTILIVGVYFYTFSFSENRTVNKRGLKPDNIVKTYWNESLNGNFSNISSLIDNTPEIYFQCYYETIHECEEKKKYTEEDSKSQKLKVKAVFEDNTVMENLTVKFPKAIFQKRWQSFAIINQWQKNDEARVRVTIRNDDLIITKDILLYKSLEDWKIFRFVEQGEREAFAPIDDLNLIKD